MDQTPPQPPINEPPTPASSPIPPTAPLTPTLPEAPSFFQKHLYLIIALAGVLVILITVLVVSAVMLSSKKPTPPPVTPPIEVVPPEPEAPTAPSKFATDSGVLEIRKHLGTVADQINSVDLTEPQLNAPNIDLGISIK